MTYGDEAHFAKCEEQLAAAVGSGNRGRFFRWLDRVLKDGDHPQFFPAFRACVAYSQDDDPNPLLELIRIWRKSRRTLPKDRERMPRPRLR